MKAFIAGRAWSFDSSDTAGRIYPRVSFCRLALLKIFVYLVIVTRYFPSRVLMTFFSLSGHRHLLRNVIRTAVGCDCASYS